MTKRYTPESVERALAHHERTRTIHLASHQDGAKPWKVVLYGVDEPMMLTTREAWAFCEGVAAGLRAPEAIRSSTTDEVPS